MKNPPRRCVNKWPSLNLDFGQPLLRRLGVNTAIWLDYSIQNWSIDQMAKSCQQLFTKLRKNPLYTGHPVMSLYVETLFSTPSEPSDRKLFPTPIVFWENSAREHVIEHWYPVNWSPFRSDSCLCVCRYRCADCQSSFPEHGGHWKKT